MKILILLLIISINTVAVMGQNQDPNLYKYWYYRDRLLRCFTAIGDKPGESMIAASRGTAEWFGSYFTALDFGEDQPIDLGWYIAVLASEYALLRAHNLDVTQTSKELYFALEAINRLDYSAEWYYRGESLGDLDGNGYSDDLNGFFYPK